MGQQTLSARIDGVRNKSDVFFGGKNTSGAFNTVVVLLENAVRASRANDSNNVVVRLHSDDSISIQDVGTGYVMDKSIKASGYLYELMYTDVSPKDGLLKEEGFPFKTANYALVQMTSEWMLVTSKTTTTESVVNFKKGLPLVEQSSFDVGQYAGTVVGTTHHWKPDKDVFGDFEFTHELLYSYLREVAYFEGVVIDFYSDKKGSVDTFNGRGALSLHKDMNGNFSHQVTCGKVIKTKGRVNSQVSVDISIITGATEFSVLFYQNGKRLNAFRGVHREAFDTALLDFNKTINWVDTDSPHMNAHTVLKAMYRLLVKRGVSVLISAKASSVSYMDSRCDAVSSKDIYQAVYDMCIVMFNRALRDK